MSHFLYLLGGAASLAATYQLSRDGILWVSTLMVVLITLLACGVANKPTLGNGRRRSLFKPIGFFISGVIAAQLVFFAYYYFTEGHEDPKLSAGVVVSVTEAFVVSFVGGLTVFFYVLTRRPATD